MFLFPLRLGTGPDEPLKSLPLVDVVSTSHIRLLRKKVHREGGAHGFVVFFLPAPDLRMLVRLWGAGRPSHPVRAWETPK